MKQKLLFLCIFIFVLSELNSQDYLLAPTESGGILYWIAETRTGIDFQGSLIEDKNYIFTGKKSGNCYLVKMNYSGEILQKKKFKNSEIKNISNIDKLNTSYVLFGESSKKEGKILIVDKNFNLTNFIVINEINTIKHAFVFKNYFYISGIKDNTLFYCQMDSTGKIIWKDRIKGDLSIEPKNMILLNNSKIALVYTVPIKETKPIRKQKLVFRIIKLNGIFIKEIWCKNLRYNLEFKDTIIAIYHHDQFIVITERSRIIFSMNINGKILWQKEHKTLRQHFHITPIFIKSTGDSFIFISNSSSPAFTKIDIHGEIKWNKSIVYNYKIAEPEIFAEWFSSSIYFTHAIDNGVFMHISWGGFIYYECPPNWGGAGCSDIRHKRRNFIISEDFDIIKQNIFTIENKDLIFEPVEEIVTEIKTEPKSVNIKASHLTASSFIDWNNKYIPIKVFDNNIKTGWLEGAKESGIGEYIEIKLEEKIIIDLIKVAPGYFDPKWWNSNNRVKKLIIDFGKKQYTASFEDLMKIQTIKLSEPISFSEVTFIIKEVYESGIDDDTGISEIEFMYKNEKIKIDYSLVN